jgi:AbrB family looped-hinge helix DNA binding protein
MEITKVSKEGQVIIPEKLRKSHGWEIGQELIIIDTGKGILLKPKKPFQDLRNWHSANDLRRASFPFLQ